MQPRSTDVHTVIAALRDPYAAFVLEQWQAGIRDGNQLYEAIRQQGYAGSLRLVWAFLQPLHEQRRKPELIVPPSPVEQLGAHSAAWLFIRDPKKLTAQQQEQLAFIRESLTSAETAYDLIRDFLTILHKREGERLDAWIEAVQASQIPELQRFVRGIVKDKDAVVAGLTLAYSNGPVEAQVQKLKLVKRSMDAACQAAFVTATLAQCHLISQTPSLTSAHLGREKERIAVLEKIFERNL